MAKPPAARNAHRWNRGRIGGAIGVVIFLFFFFLGHDPNGDYTYTKGQHYGAEEWLLMSDNTDTSGRRAVVIFANFGKKYLAIKNGKLTGVTKQDPECRWYLE